ncbi:hypothetical protein QTO34_016911 [Cnephaeus nilssonii]|uniref:FAM124 domain-containing protein n=1 Tax=Cnephaeus nilssonii TaxID=3371016 RepID=A0AA40I397_CNENI|nr:hypothetical protein QTO34_016911 [Eptesicus nilssonii]
MAATSPLSPPATQGRPRHRQASNGGYTANQGWPKPQASLRWQLPSRPGLPEAQEGFPEEEEGPKAKAAQPALAVVLFLQEGDGDEPVLQLHRALQRPPWRHHHTERVPGRLLPYLPCSQDFFTLAPGTPLWAIRPVHYGREIVRFTIYCRHDNYADILKFYELILRRSPSQRKVDFCIFPVFSSLDVDIQFSLKRLPCGQNPVPTDSSVLEFRVKDIGELVPLLPNPCSPISEGRWQTEDHDGNKVLLQAQRVHGKFPKPNRAHHSSEQKPPSTPSPSCTTPSRTPGSGQQPRLDSPRLAPSQAILLAGHQQEFATRASSTTSLPGLSKEASAPGHRPSEWRHGHLLSIDDLEGSQETDVDTGLWLSSSDLSVVSAYSAPSRFFSALEAPFPSERGGSHCSKHKGSREGPLPTGSGATMETSWASLPSFAEGPSGSLATAVAAPPASGATTLTESSSKLPGDAPYTEQTGRHITPSPALAGPGDSDTEEFYI